MNSFISYEGLPIKSGGAHSISFQSPNSVLEKLMLFMKTYTNCINPASCNIVNNNFQLKQIFRYSWLLSSLPKFDINNFIAHRSKTIWWKLSPSKIDEAIKLIDKNSELVLTIEWKFQFVDLSTKKLLEGQREIPVIDERLHNSQIYLRLSKNKSTISVWFTFPFDNMQGYNAEYIDGIRTLMPFKFSEKNWRLWTLSNKGNWIPKVIDMTGKKENVDADV